MLSTGNTAGRECFFVAHYSAAGRGGAGPGGENPADGDCGNTVSSRDSVEGGGVTVSSGTAGWKKSGKGGDKLDRLRVLGVKVVFPDGLFDWSNWKEVGVGVGFRCQMLGLFHR